MVTILRPHRHKHDEALPDITDENPGNAVRPDGSGSTGTETGTELSEDDADQGTASAPGEGPNPTT